MTTMYNKRCCAESATCNRYKPFSDSGCSNEKGPRNIKRHIVQDSLLIHFSEYWGNYYDFDCAGGETLRAYAADVANHRFQVAAFLEDYSDEELLQIGEDLQKRSSRKVTSDDILKVLGYEYKDKKIAQDENMQNNDISGAARGYSEEYKRIRKEAEATWPAWKVETHNANFATSAHAIKIVRLNKKDHS